MSFVTIIWSMVASACLTLAAIHLLVWCQGRRVWDDLLFTLTSAGIAALAGCEFWMMRAETPAQFATAVRWLHVPLWVVVLAMVCFVRLHLRAGRLWLAWTICVLRTLALVLNFLVGQNLNYREVTHLRHMPFLGEVVSIGKGVSNPYMLIGQLSLVLWMVYLTDAAITVWRRGDRRQALVTGGSMVFFALVGTTQAVLVAWQIVEWPITASLSYMGMVLAMSYELSRETIRAAQLFHDLHESETQMAVAAEAAGLGIWIWTIATGRVWGSERWLRLFGFSPNAAITVDEVFERIHSDDREVVEAAMRQAVKTGTDYVGEYRVTLPDGTERWLAVRGRMYPEPSDTPARMVGAAIEVTSRKRAEQDIAQQRSELAHITRVFTMSHLNSSIAHELNQPLGAILRNAEAAELLLQAPSPDLDEIRAILGDIRNDAQRAGNVIDRLRSLLKRRSLELTSLALDKLTDDVMMLVRSDAASRHVRLEAHVPSGLTRVRGDRVHLQQVLLNLIINAMDALDDKPDDERHVAIRAKMDGNGMVEVAVSDSGDGILPETIERLFDPFFTTKSRGMGMGLPISRTIIEAHGGRIWAENNADGGATFRFTLCAAVAEDKK